MSFEDIIGRDTGGRIERMYADARQQRENDAVGKPYRLMGMEFGKPALVSAHDTREEAEKALADIRRTCAPFVRDIFRLTGPGL